MVEPNLTLSGDDCGPGMTDTEYVTSFLPLLVVSLMVLACHVFSGATAKPHGRVEVVTEVEKPTTSSGAFLASY